MTTPTHNPTPVPAMQSQMSNFPISLDDVYYCQQLPSQLPLGPSAEDNLSFKIKEEMRDTLVLPVLDSGGTIASDRLGKLTTWYQLSGDSTVNTYHQLVIDRARLVPHFGFADTEMIHDLHTPLKGMWSGITMTPYLNGLF